MQLSSSGMKYVLVVSLVVKQRPVPEKWLMDPLDSNFLVITQTISMEREQVIRLSPTCSVALQCHKEHGYLWL